MVIKARAALNPDRIDWPALRDQIDLAQIAETFSAWNRGVKVVGSCGSARFMRTTIPLSWWTPTAAVGGATLAELEGTPPHWSCVTKG